MNTMVNIAFNNNINNCERHELSFNSVTETA